jgi:hypothetical protein
MFGIQNPLFSDTSPQIEPSTILTFAMQLKEIAFLEL